MPAFEESSTYNLDTCFGSDGCCESKEADPPRAWEQQSDNAKSFEYGTVSGPSTESHLALTSTHAHITEPNDNSDKAKDATPGSADSSAGNSSSSSHSIISPNSLEEVSKLEIPPPSQPIPIPKRAQRAPHTSLGYGTPTGVWSPLLKNAD